MKKKIIPAVVLFMVIGFIGYGIKWAFFDIQRIDGQEYITKSESPNGTYLVTAYLNNGGATTDYAVLCSVENKLNGKEKNIYWNYHCDSVDILWTDDDTVVINGIALNLPNQTYDYRYN